MQLYNVKDVVAGTSKGLAVPVLEGMAADSEIVRYVVPIVKRVELEVPESSNVPERKEKTSTTA